MARMLEKIVSSTATASMESFHVSSEGAKVVTFMDCTDRVDINEKDNKLEKVKEELKNSIKELETMRKELVELRVNNCEGYLTDWLAMEERFDIEKKKCQEELKEV